MISSCNPWESNTCCLADIPDPPENVKCTGVGEDCANIIWEPPKFDGGAPLKGNTHYHTHVNTRDAPRYRLIKAIICIIGR